MGSPMVFFFNAKLRACVLAICAILLLCGAEGQVRAAAADAAPVVIAIGPGTEYSPVVAANTSNNQSLVVWFDVSRSSLVAGGSHSRVFGRRVGADGKPLGNPFVISRRGSLNPTLGGGRPAAAYNARRKEYLVVYDRSYAGSAEPGIFAQRVAASGLLVGNEITIFSGATQHNPRIAYDTVLDRYLVVWTGARGVLGLMLNALGIPEGAGGVFAPSGATTPALAFNPSSGHYLLAFTYPTGTISDVFAQVLNGDGALVSQRAISTAEGEQSVPGVAADARSNHFLVVWTDGCDATNAPAAYGQLLDGNGGLVGDNTRMADAAFFPQAVFSGLTEKYLLAWQVNDPNSKNHEFIHGRLYEGNLTESGAAFAISGAKAAGRVYAGLNPFSGNALAVWAGLASGKRSAILGRSVTMASPTARLVLTMSGKPNPARTGQDLNYTLRIVNNGTATARTVVLRDRLPASLRYVAATTDRGDCQLAEATTVRCAVGNLPPAVAAKVIITVTAEGIGRVINRATVEWRSRGSTVATASAKTVTRIR